MIIDTNRRTTNRLPCLRTNGVTGIIRYYARSTGQPEKRLILSEAQAIVGAGIQIGVVSQSAGNSASYFSHATGLLDGAYARNYGATVIGQPSGSAIYFAVDYDANQNEVTNRIVPYFQAIAQTFAPSAQLPEYQVGVYGNGLVCKTLLDQGLVDFTWLSMSTGHHGHQQFKNSNRWTLLQRLSTTLCSIGIDPDELRSGVTDFGGFSQIDDPSAAAPLQDEPASIGMAGAAVASASGSAAPTAAAGFDEQAFIDFVNGLNLRHFKSYELLVMGSKHSNPQSPCHGKNTYPPQNLWTNIAQTLKVLDALRTRLNAPIRIISAYRSLAYNTCIGGAGASAHMEFYAIDFVAEGNSRPVDWARMLRSMRDDEGMFSGGVGLYSSFVHVDTNGDTRDW